ncbi:MAG TPA: hypothetical protein VMB22_09045 [Verrucomicrobiae bacterium]|nr:hypothetical protein [Verrucomicrobiae bacterium]
MKTRLAVAILIVVWTTAIVLGILIFKRWPQQLVLPDGTKLTLAAVTLGKHHVFPDTKVRGAQLNTPTDALCVWLRESFTNGAPDYQVLEFDQSGTFCAGRITAIRRFPDGKGADVACVRLDSFPRRAGKLLLQIAAMDADGDWTNLEKKFTVTFPAQSSFAPLQPQTLPVTASDGDLNVTLTKVAYGVSMSHPRKPATDPTDEGVLASFRIMQNGVVVNNWRPARIETWDAEGNYSDGRGRIMRNGDEISMLYQWGLSPDEPWKMRVEMARTGDFSDDETWKISGIPVSTNAGGPLRGNLDTAYAITNIGDSTVRVFPANLPVGGQTAQLRFWVDPAPPAPPSVNFRLVSVTDENGQALRTPSRSWAGRYFNFNVAVGDAKTINATVALQSGSHLFDFTVQPTKQ